MSYLKGVPSGAAGNKRLLGKYGGNSGSGPNARQHYARGGAVKAFASGGAALDEGLSASGSPAKPSLSRPGRKAPSKGKDGKGKTTVNVIIAGGGKPGADGPPPGGPMAGPPMPPPGAGGPPPGGPPMPPMRANGGRIANLGKYAHGGKVGKYARGGKAMPPKGLDAGMMSEKGREEKIELQRKARG